MTDVVLISVSKLDLQRMIIDCLDICLKNYPVINKDSIKEEPDRWLNLKELREYHPDKPSEATIYFWVRGNAIPYHKNEGQKKLRFLKSEIDEFIKSGKQKSKDEIKWAADQHAESLYK